MTSFSATKFSDCRPLGSSVWSGLTGAFHLNYELFCPLWLFTGKIEKLDFFENFLTTKAFIDRQVILEFQKFKSLKSSLIALVGDFFIDVYFLQGLSTDTLIDVKYIHFEYGALLTMVCFEFSAFLCLPITAFVFYKVKFAENFSKNFSAF